LALTAQPSQELCPRWSDPAFDGLTQLSEEGIMPTYILMSTLTPEGRQTLHKDPDRLEQVNKEITDFGCKVVAQ